MKKLNLAIAFGTFLLISGQVYSQIPILDAYDEPLPKVVTPGLQIPDGGQAAPSDAISLFNGIDLSEWTNDNGSVEWTVHDGMFTVKDGAGSIHTKREFGDFQLHIEWMHPSDITGEGQNRGNSGIFMHGLYEVQVLESYNNNNKTYVNGQAGAIYKQHPPLVNPLKEPGRWNAYDVIFSAPTFNFDGTYKTNPKITVLINGILVQNNAVIYGGTSGDKIVNKTRGGIMLQDHHCTVNYRNIWIREL